MLSAKSNSDRSNALSRLDGLNKYFSKKDDEKAKPSSPIKKEEKKKEEKKKEEKKTTQTNSTTQGNTNTSNAEPKTDKSEVVEDFTPEYEINPKLINEENPVGGSSERESEIQWPAGFENWTFNEQLKYIENVRFNKQLGNYYFGMKQIGRFLNINVSIDKVDVAVEFVMFDENAGLSSEKLTDAFGRKYTPEYDKPFVYLVNGTSISIDNDDIKKIMNIVDDTISNGGIISTGIIYGREYKDNKTPYFKSPEDYNGIFESTSMTVGRVVITGAGDPDGISKTSSTGLTSSKGVSIGFGISDYKLIPQRHTEDFNDFIKRLFK